MEEGLDFHSLEVCKSRINSPVSGMTVWDAASRLGDRPARHQQVVFIKLLGIHNTVLDSMYIKRYFKRHSPYSQRSF